MSIPEVILLSKMLQKSNSEAKRMIPPVLRLYYMAMACMKVALEH